MKINKFLLVSIFLLAIISLCAVSASDDADNLAVNDDVGAVESPADEIDVVAEDDGDVSDEKEDVSGMGGNIYDNLEGYPISYEVYSDDPISGNISFSIDDVEYLNTEFESGKLYSIDTSKLPEGEYTMIVSYLGDSYYNPYTYEEFVLIKGLFDADEYSFIEADGWIDVNIPEDARGYLSIYLNGTRVLREAIYNEDDGSIRSFQLNNCSCGVYNLTVTYEGDTNFRPVSKSIITEIGYSLMVLPRSQFDQESIVFGDKNIIELVAPSDVDWNKMSVKINDKTYQVVHKEDMYYVDIANLTPATYTVSMAYAGDDRYYPSDVNSTFEIIYKPHMNNYMDYGDDENITFTLPNAKGDFIVTLNKKEFAKVKFNDGVAVVPLNELGPGEYEAEFKYVGDDYGNIEIAGDDLTVYAKFIMPESILTVADNLNVTLIMPKDATGKLMVAVDGDYENPLEAPIKDGVAVVPLKLKLSENSIEINAYYSESDSQCFKATQWVYMYPVNSEWNRSVAYNEPAEFIFEMPEDAKGNYVIYIDGEVRYNKTLTNGIAKVTFDDLETGNYDISIEYGDDKYGNWTDSGFLTVGPKLSYHDRINIGDDNYFALELPGYKGNLSYDVYYDAGIGDRVSKTVPFDSSINIILDGSKAGLMHVSYELDSEDGPNFSDWFYIKIMQTPVISIAAPDIHEGEDAVITVTIDDTPLPDDFTVTVLNKTTIYYSEEGKTVKNITLSDLKAGEYTVFVQFDESAFTKPVNATCTFKVLEKSAPKVDPVIIASNAKVIYSAGSYYTIKVFGDDGKLADGVSVVITVAGKTFKKLTTNNGIAKFKVTQIPKAYKMNITSLGKSVIKTLTVKHVVTLSTVKVKKSAKKLVLTAKLSKVNGKYLKNKKVTFKFNGKTYKAKTSKTGVAKVTIKSSVLKKLKVGKKVTYQATYLKDTVKKTVKVKK